MKKTNNIQIHILSNDVINGNSAYQFQYQNRMYSLTINPATKFDTDNIKVLNAFCNLYNRIVPNPLKISANDKYLIFKVRYKVDYMPEDFVYMAKNSVTHTDSEI